MSEEWVIDGYNLFYDRSSESRTSNSKIPKTDLTALIHRLAGFAASKKDHRLLLVFDGHIPENEWKVLATPSFQIISSGKITADSVIEKYLCDNKGRRMIVVTKDRAVCQMAFGSGAGVLEPKEFMRLVEQSEKESRENLFREDVRSHGFHRPFGDKLSDLP